MNTANQYVTPKYELLSIESHKPVRLDADETSGDSSFNNQTNLAIKGIIAIGAMSAMSLAAGYKDDANNYKVRHSSSNPI